MAGGMVDTIHMTCRLDRVFMNPLISIYGQILGQLWDKTLYFKGIGTIFRRLCESAKSYYLQKIQKIYIVQTISIKWRCRQNGYMSV